MLSSHPRILGPLINAISGYVLFGSNGAFRHDSLFFWDNTNKRLGLGTSTPSTRLHVISDLLFSDLASSATKQFRWRTSGGNLDIDFGGKDLFINGYAAVDFSGTQKNYLIFGGEFEFVKGNKKWIWTDSAGGDGMTWDPNNGHVVNEGGLDRDTRIEGDTDANLVFVDAGTDRVGIGNNAPNNKLDVTGTVQMDGLRIDVAPNAETITPTHTITISVNGTNYKIPIVAA
jgi:hypothetical protein